MGAMGDPTMANIERLTITLPAEMARLSKGGRRQGRLRFFQ